MMTDADIVTQVLAGQRSEFAKLVERYLTMVRGLCASHVRECSAHDDLVQATFTDGYLKLNSLRQRERFGPWLAAIARNKCISWIRSETRRVRAHEALAVSSSEFSPSPSDAASREELHRFVQAQIAQLPERTREAMALCYVEGLSIRDAAWFLDVSEAALKKRLQYGRQLVGELLWKELEGRERPEPASDRLKHRVLAAIPFTTAPFKAGMGPVIVGALAANKVAVSFSLLLAISALVVGVGWFRGTRAAAGTPDGAAAKVLSETRQSETTSPAQIPESKSNTARSDVGKSSANPGVLVSAMTNDADSIRGMVVDAGSGEPVKGIEVVLEDKASSGSAITRKTDDTGRFVFSRIGGGERTLSLNVKGFVRVFLPMAPIEVKWQPGTPAPDIEVKLTHKGTVSGKVLRADGSPAPGASISIESAGIGASHGRGTSAADGSYVLVHDGGVFCLNASGYGGASTEPVSFELGPAASTTHDFVMPLAMCLKFRLTASDGRAVTNIAKVFHWLIRKRLTEGVGGVESGGELPREGDSFVIGYAMPGVYDVVLRPDGYKALLVPQFAVTEGEREKQLTLALTPVAESLTVQALNASGGAAANERVVVCEQPLLYSESGDAVDSGSGFQDGITDANGVYTFRGLRDGKFEASIAFKNGDAARSEVVLPRSAALTLRAASPDPGKADKVPKVSLTWKVSDALANGMEVDDSLGKPFLFRIADGTFVDNSDSAAPADYLYVYVFPGHTAAVERVTVRKELAGKNQAVRVALGKGGSISGVVHREDGRTLGGQDILVYPDQEPVRRFLDSGDDTRKDLGVALAQRCKSQSDGAFVLRFLPPGRYLVGLSADDLVGPFAVQANGDAGPVELVRRQRAGSGE